MFKYHANQKVLLVQQVKVDANTTLPDGTILTVERVTSEGHVVLTGWRNLDNTHALRLTVEPTTIIPLDPRFELPEVPVGGFFHDPIEPIRWPVLSYGLDRETARLYFDTEIFGRRMSARPDNLLPAPPAEEPTTVIILVIG